MNDTSRNLSRSALHRSLPNTFVQRAHEIPDVHKKITFASRRKREDERGWNIHGSPLPILVLYWISLLARRQDVFDFWPPSERISN